MIEKILITSGSFIIFFLGSLHLAYTFFTNKFQPYKNDKLESEMKNATPVLTRRTTMWNAWIGFNASHSLGAIYFGLVNFLFAQNDLELFRNVPALLWLDLAFLLFFLFLGIKYWFRIPLTGIIISTLCFAGATIILLQK